MITIKEYLLTKNYPKPKELKVVTSTEELKELVDYEIEKNGENVDLNFIDVSNITSMRGLFKSTGFCGDISLWDVSNLVFASRMFQFCENFNCDLSQWNLSSLEDGYGMFYACKNFDCDVSKWNIKNLEKGSCMFQACRSFKGTGIEKWHVERLAKAELMFGECDVFNGNVGKWKIKKLDYARGMFLDCKVFNQNLEKWNVKNLINSENMFLNCPSFEGNGLDKWNPVKLKVMNNMFGDCKNLSVDIHDWELPDLDMKNMDETFDGCHKMNTWQKPQKYRKQHDEKAWLN